MKKVSSSSMKKGVAEEVVSGGGRGQSRQLVNRRRRSRIRLSGAAAIFGRRCRISCGSSWNAYHTSGATAVA